MAMPLDGVGPTVTEVLNAVSCGCDGAPPGAYCKVTGPPGDVASKVMERAVCRTIPIGPCGTSWKLSSGVRSAMLARSQRSTSTCCDPWRTTNPSLPQLSTMPWPLLTTPEMNL